MRTLAAAVTGQYGCAMFNVFNVCAALDREGRDDGWSILTSPRPFSAGVAGVAAAAD